MKHPLVSNKTAFSLYVLAWVLFVSIQTLAFYQLFKVSWFQAIADSVVFGGLFFLMGLGIWFFVRYSSRESQSVLSLFVEHITSALVLVSIWVWGGSYLLAFTFSSSPDYVSVLWDSIVWRYANGFLLYIMLVVVYYLFIGYQEKLERKVHESKLKATLQNAEIDLLRSKLNPHFLFNSLNSLHALIQTDVDKAGEMLVQLSDFLRFSLEKETQEKIPLYAELENLRRYLSIEQLRFGKRLHLSEDFEEKCMSLLLPAMVLQPLLENAIKYGLGSQTGDVEISMHIHCKNEKLQIVIQNNYDVQVDVRKGSGQGLRNVQKRLQMMYKNTARFEVKKEKDIFNVIMEIPQSQSNG